MSSCGDASCTETHNEYAGRRVPVTVLTGFLGSGKTTLLNHILKSQEHKMKFAIIENEFGEVGVDEKLLVGEGGKMKLDDEIVEVMNGCICCTVRNDLVEALKRLYEKVEQFDGVLIETTGMADPAPVAQTFFVDKQIEKMYRLDGIVTVVDAMHIEYHLDKEVKEGAENESVEQLAFADRIILNKCDLIRGACSGETAVSDRETIAKCLEEGATADQFYQKKNLPVSGEVEDPDLKLQKLETRIRQINPTATILRTEFSKVEPSKLLNAQAFSLDRVMEMDPEFLNVDGEHEHDDSVSSVAWSFPGMELNITKLRWWVGELMRDLGTELYRFKGVLAVKGKKEKFIFQGVHMLFEGKFAEDQEWGEDEQRECRFVFIGKHVKQQHAGRLKSEFLELQAEDPLRFKQGEIVLARHSSGWRRCQVVRTWAEGHPYQLEVQSFGIPRQLVWGPLDDDFCIRPYEEGGEDPLPKSTTGFSSPIRAGRDGDPPASKRSRTDAGAQA
uniref:CobW C-terminal domain-containing protein n=1 Tax=Chromera velia CCMP2878 TaxID=1169474 RepID=A0A0G4FU06_9ALVE|eukprot:Cvel_3727.t1-p1 / transcript=Cvel_3727.t1 / gene=Cvel_3727 / organism=Chromera_velia_CCMP2878 / gene_product=COBW domain-containing protein 1, putative / transcript_product=COBW domain-containing protein 1, putative / location=Cvel_scaffold155:28803-30872(+) / protein_length=501 / sequence_SO=supercontig / SO=protein_coding / is_pseudo=false